MIIRSDIIDKEVLDDCLADFEIRRDIEHLDKLSLGEKHKVAFSIALSLGTKVLLLDEAANGMDIPARKMFRKLLMNRLQPGASFMSEYIIRIEK